MALEWWWWWPETAICPTFSLTSFSKHLPTIVIQFDITFDIIGPISAKKILGLASHGFALNSERFVIVIIATSSQNKPRHIDRPSALSLMEWSLNPPIVILSTVQIFQRPIFSILRIPLIPLSWRSTTQRRNQNICQFDLFCILSLPIPQNI